MLGDWDTNLVDLELKDNAKPYHLKVYPILHIYKENLKKECIWLYKIEVLKKSIILSESKPFFHTMKNEKDIPKVLRKVNDELFYRNSTG